MCTNQQKPSGLVADNTFFTLEGCPAINPAFDGCDSNLTQQDNHIYDYDAQAVHVTSTLLVVQVTSTLLALHATCCPWNVHVTSM